MNLSLFGKKKKKSAPLPGGMSDGPGGQMQGRPPPTHEVQALSSRGMAEPDIISTLRNEGYNTMEIDHAMKEALRSKVAGPGHDGQQPMQRPSPPPAGPPGQPFGPPNEMEDRQNLPGPMGPPRFPLQGFDDVGMDKGMVGGMTGADFGRPSSMPFEEEPLDLIEEPRRRPERGNSSKDHSRKEIEELVEVVVDEKIRELQNKFGTINHQFTQMSNKIEMVRSDVGKINDEKKSELKEIEDKIDTYKQTITMLSGRIESMEGALKDSLTPMMESMRSLSETIQLLKERG